jgi:hypothetical protein
MNLRKVITEALITKKVISDCNCGCKASEKCNKAPILNESVAPREILSEGLKYHIDNNKPLTEHLYRAGSKNYFNLWSEARALYVRNVLDFSGDDLEILTETHLGEFGIFEGKKVPLDFIMEDEYLDLNEINLKSAGVRDAIEKLKVHFKELGFPSLKAAIDFIKGGSIEDWEEIRGELAALNEEKKKNPPLNKPKRGGSKAYYVYVKDPKTKRIKKVSFGSGGLNAKINNPKARQAFAKRHRCSEKNDKTKASYWSCRLPRYAKLLGLKSNFSGFW